jgi:hypothetical protein
MSSNTETRHIIRPEHFALAPQLLGMELARPARRLAAILLDLVLVTILVQTAGPGSSRWRRRTPSSASRRAPRREAPRASW